MSPALLGVKFDDGSFMSPQPSFLTRPAGVGAPLLSLAFTASRIFDPAVVGAGDGAFHQDQAALGIGADDFAGSGW